MNLMKITLTAALAAGMALAQAGPAQGPGKGAGRMMVRNRMFHALNLTDAQKQQAKDIFSRARETAAPVAKQLRENRQALSAAVQANDTGRIQHLSAQQGTLQGQLLTIRSEAMAQFVATLTPEQKAKAAEARQHIRERMQNRMQKRMERKGNG